MKQVGILFFLLVFVLIASSGRQNGPDTGIKGKTTGIKFDQIIHDFGKIEYNGNGVCVFEFENTGKEPLIILKVRGDCGCTVPSWTKEPVRSGEKGTIKLKYNTRIVGYFSKNIRVYTNTGRHYILLRITGQVAEKK